MTEELLIAGAPVFAVDSEVQGALARDVVRLEIEESTEGLKTLRARFLAFGPNRSPAEEEMLYLDGRVFDFGKPIEVTLGSASAPRILFKGFISAIEASFEEGKEPEVLVFAEDRLMDLRMTRRLRTFEDMSDAQIAEEIAGEHGLSAEVDAEGPTYDVVQQWNMSDLAFLRERARLIQAEIWVQGGALHFKSRSRRSAPEAVLVQGNHLVSLQVRADLAHQRSEVKVSGYDAQTREVIEEGAGGDEIRSEIADGRSGPEILERAFGPRVSHRVREVPLTDGEARDFARNEMLRRSRAFVTACGVTRGTADMVVGSRLSLQRVGRAFEGRGYYATWVQHTYDLSSGFRTLFEAERATVEGGR